MVNIENFKILKYHTVSKKNQFFLLFAVSVAEKIKIFKEEKSFEILKIIDLTNNIE